MKDRETEKLLSEAEKTQNFVLTEGWKIARGMLEKKIEGMMNVKSLVLEGRSSDDIAKELRERQSVVEIMEQWIMDVEGLATSAQHYVQTGKPEDNLITYYE